MFSKICSYTFLTVLTVDLLATSGDITMTWTSPIFPKLYSNDTNINPLDTPISEEEESWIGSLINVGAMIGPLPFGFIAEKFGRKYGLLAIAIPHIISYLTLAFATSPYLYYFARILGGIAVGGGYTVLPMYVAEVAEDSNRGMLSVTLNIFWTFGNLIPYVIGPFISVMWFNIILACIPSAFFVLFLLIAPESPYFLLKEHREDDARKALSLLRSQNEKQIELELEHIKAGLVADDEEGSFLDLFRTRVALKSLGISLTLVLAQQLSGIDAVLFYTQEIFSDAGADSISPEVSAIIIGVICFLSTFGAPFLADRSGRKFLLLISCIGSTIAHVAFGVFFYLKDSTDTDVSSLSWLPIASLILYMTTFNMGLGCLPWTVAAELLPTNVKSYGASLVSVVSYTTSFLVTKFYNNLNSGLGEGGTFWLFGGFCFASFLFVVFVMPETKGKSFEEIQEILSK